jgi:hypothetical protein
MPMSGASGRVSRVWSSRRFCSWAFGKSNSTDLEGLSDRWGVWSGQMPAVGVSRAGSGGLGRVRCDRKCLELACNVRSYRADVGRVAGSVMPGRVGSQSRFGRGVVSGCTENEVRSQRLGVGCQGSSWVGRWVAGVGRVCRVGDTGLGHWGLSGRVRSGSLGRCDRVLGMRQWSGRSGRVPDAIDMFGAGV